MFSDTDPLDGVSEKKPHLTLKDEKNKLTNLKKTVLWIDESIFKAFLGSLIVKQAVESAAMLQYYVFYCILDFTILILENSFKNNKTIFLNGSTCPKTRCQSCCHAICQTCVVSIINVYIYVAAVLKVTKAMTKVIM